MCLQSSLDEMQLGGGWSVLLSGIILMDELLHGLDATHANVPQVFTQRQLNWLLQGWILGHQHPNNHAKCITVLPIHLYGLLTIHTQNITKNEFTMNPHCSTDKQKHTSIDACKHKRRQNT